MLNNGERKYFRKRYDELLFRNIPFPFYPEDLSFFKNKNTDRMYISVAAVMVIIVLLIIVLPQQRQLDIKKKYYSKDILVESLHMYYDIKEKGDMYE